MGIMPNSLAMSEFPQAPTGAHDLYILAVREFRRGGIRGVLFTAAQTVSDAAARAFEPVLLWLRPTRTLAAARCRGVRNVCISCPGFAQPRDLAAGRCRFQSPAPGVLQIQIPVHRSRFARSDGRHADRPPPQTSLADRHLILCLSQYQPSGRLNAGEG